MLGEPPESDDGGGAIGAGGAPGANLDEACARAGDFDWIVFSSVNAVDAFMDRLLAGPTDVRALGGVRLCGVGAATAARLEDHGLKVDLTPLEYRADAVLRALTESGDIRGKRMLLPHADIGRELLTEAGTIFTRLGMRAGDAVQRVIGEL